MINESTSSYSTMSLSIARFVSKIPKVLYVPYPVNKDIRSFKNNFHGIKNENMLESSIGMYSIFGGFVGAFLGGACINKLFDTSTKSSQNVITADVPGVASVASVAGVASTASVPGASTIAVATKPDNTPTMPLDSIIKKFDVDAHKLYIDELFKNAHNASIDGFFSKSQTTPKFKIISWSNFNSDKHILSKDKKFMLDIEKFCRYGIDIKGCQIKLNDTDFCLSYSFYCEPRFNFRSDGVQQNFVNEISAYTKGKYPNVHNVKITTYFKEGTVLVQFLIHSNDLIFCEM